MKTHVLIDGDEFLFKGCAAVEDKVKWDDEDAIRYADPEKAWKNIKEMIERVYGRFRTKSHTICLSTNPRTNFRYAVDPTYKNNRTESVKPICYMQMLERLQNEYTCKDFHDLEADDVMGMLATQPSKVRKIIVSQDKDMKTIPGTLWTGKDLLNITEDEANYWHLFQTLVGDTADGYKGCPKIGKVKAEKMLFGGAPPWGTPEEAWAIVKGAYEKAGLTEDDALRQARLARILRWSDWDQEKKVPILWTPNTTS